jgi:D-aminopeptidase
MQKVISIFIIVLSPLVIVYAQEKKTGRDYGIRFGVLPVGKQNAITDVDGVKVGHSTVIAGGNVRTGVTAILPHDGNIFQQKVPAAIFVGNGFGKLAGSTQIQELGNIETPIVLTNTLSVGTALDAVVEYTLLQKGNENVRSVNAVVGETNDAGLNDIRGRHIKKNHVLEAIINARSGSVLEGNVGAGTGTVCFGFKGGIGTSSRVLPEPAGGYTIGVLVQTNFGGTLLIDGVPVGEALKGIGKASNDGSCMIVVATDAPVDARNLERIAMRAMMGLARTGGIASNGSGDYVIAFSTHSGVRIRHNTDARTETVTLLLNDAMSPLFQATIEATEEAIINSLFAAETMEGHDGHVVKALPVKEVLEILRKHNSIK